MCLLFLGPAADSLAESTPPETGPGCVRLFSTNDHNRLARAVFDHRRWHRRDPVGKSAHNALELQRRCARTDTARDKMKVRWLDAKHSFYRYRGLRLIAPYPGAGTWWAIPYSIVSCESGGSWGAYNKSGASGPYQLLGWGAPYPARTWEQKMANHRIAARVWNGGAGRSNWVC